MGDGEHDDCWGLCLTNKAAEGRECRRGQRGRAGSKDEHKVVSSEQTVAIQTEVLHFQLKSASFA